MNKMVWSSWVPITLIIFISQCYAAEVCPTSGSVIDFANNIERDNAFNQTPQSYKDFVGRADVILEKKLSKASKKVSTDNPAYPKAVKPDIVQEAQNAMLDNKAFKEWFIDLLKEVGISMSKSTDPAVLKDLAIGKINPKIWVKTLKERAVKQGFKPILSIRDLKKPSEIQKLASQEQLFFDVTFSGESHGRDTHVLQLLYFDAYSGGKGKKLLSTLGSNGENFSFWRLTLDSSQPNLTSPEFFNISTHDAANVDWESAYTPNSR